ncbi:M949_RS01915 family surface polysaccharide biosynthesis protein [Myroides odoratimimus]|uniref:M949_RS01915 family surface polysaccharide biosynthesis protein n=1 Tax=Myroides odoratimimus TaxID=76832 RepID=UPI0009104273|nr:hypothetical protein [Myroides odoratimimus]SHM45326.1 hypothetical protein SAMN05444275_113104 [Myroides odoratimimus subsp. xuanwuensis]
MNKMYIIIFSLLSLLTYPQSNNVYQKYGSLEPDLALNILDLKNSASKFDVKVIEYNQIPTYLDFRGVIVSAVKWNDNLGENILILSSSGTYYTDEESGNIKTEIYAYLFVKKVNNNRYMRFWRMYDFIDCGPVDTGIFYIRNALTITDLNNNGIAEISFPYFLQCRGDISDDILKYMLYENNIKYALRGTNKQCKTSKEYQGGGKYTASDNLENNSIFSSFLQQQWDKYKCWESIRYPNN